MKTRESPEEIELKQHPDSKKQGPVESNHEEDKQKHTAKEGDNMPTQTMSKLQQVLLVLTCTGAMILNSSNGTAVAVALPTIGQSLRIPESTLQWAVSAYSLSSGCLQLVFGRLADLYGRKRMFIFSTIWLIGFSLACSFANDEITLEVLRGFQGVGGSALMPAVFGILAHAFPPSKARGVAFATFSAGAPAGAAFGMILGGLLTELTKKTWHSVFYLSVGLTFLVMVGGIFIFPPDLPSTEPDKRVDWLGAVLVTVSLVLIVFVLGQAELARHQWQAPYIIALLLVGVLLFMLFLVWQYYLERMQKENIADDLDSTHSVSKFHPPPLMKLSLWGRAKGRFTAICVVAFLQMACFLSWNFWVQLYYQSFLHYSPIGTVVRLLPMFIVGGICNVIMALLVGKVSFVFIVASGTMLTSLAALLFAVINPASPYWSFGFPSAILSVIGTDFVFAAGSVFVVKCAQPHEQSLAGGIFQTMMQIGTAFGVTITTIVFDHVANSHLGTLSFVPGGPPSPPPHRRFVTEHGHLSSRSLFAWVLPRPPPLHPPRHHHRGHHEHRHPDAECNYDYEEENGHHGHHDSNTSPSLYKILLEELNSKFPEHGHGHGHRHLPHPPEFDWDEEDYSHHRHHPSPSPDFSDDEFDFSHFHSHPPHPLKFDVLDSDQLSLNSNDDELYFHLHPPSPPPPPPPWEFDRHPPWNRLHHHPHVFLSNSSHGGSPAPPPDFAPLQAYQAAQWMAFGFGVLATTLTVIFLRGVGIVGHPGPAKKKKCQGTNGKDVVRGAGITKRSSAGDAPSGAPSEG